MPGFSKRLIFTFTVAGLLSASVFAAKPPAIVVEYGAYPSAVAAAADEAAVRWADGDPSDDIICTTSFAAVELQHYLRKITGQADGFEIRKPGAFGEEEAEPLIFLGTLDRLDPKVLAAAGISKAVAEGLGAEGYVLKSASLQGRKILLIAAPERIGVLYGAYDLLHRLGVRWFAPGEDHADIPHLSLDPLPEFDVKSSPAFATRGFHAWENRAGRDFLLWMARNRMNFWCVEQEDKPFLHKLGFQLIGGAHVLTSLYLGPKLDYPYNHLRFPGDEGKPADPYGLSAEYQGDADKDGRLSYFEAHPEWFGLQQGKRSPKIEGDFGDNICTSNKDAMAEWTKNAVQDLIDGRYKDAGLMNAWTLDVGRWCECEACKALGKPTDRNLRFVHDYAQAIKAARKEGRLNRPVRLLFLSYADVIEPPTRPLPADFDYDMCIATFFPIVRCYVHDFDASNCTVNGAYQKNFNGWFLDQARHYRGQICIGEYYNVSGYKCLPAGYMHTMAHDIPNYYKAGARHFHYMHVTTDQWGTKALTNWQMARQIWSPSEDAEALWADYFGRRYGPAKDHMRRIYETLENALSNITDLKYSLARRLGKGEHDLFPTAHLKFEKTETPVDDGPDFLEIVDGIRRVRKMFDEAGTIGLPEGVKRSIAEDEKAFVYAERTIHFYNALIRTKSALDQNRIQQAREDLMEAQYLADLLKDDKVSTSFSSSHANAPDALDASYAAPALKRFANRIAAEEKRGISNAPVYPDKTKLMIYLDKDGREHPVRNAADWEIRRNHVLLNFQKVAGPHPDPREALPLDLRIENESDLGGVVRRKVSFAAEPGDRISAYLFLPSDATARKPGVLCLHQTIPVGKDEPAGLSATTNIAYALELARRGYVTLAPDYPGFGEEDIDPYALGYESATIKGIWNHRRCIDLLVSLPQVDPERLAVIGYSLGGHNAMFAALFDRRLKAVVTSSGFTSFPKYYGGDLTGWSHKGYMPKIASVFGKDPAKMPFDFTEILAALAPRPVFVNAPLKDDNFDVSGVDDCVRAASPIYELLGAKDAIVVVHPDLPHSFTKEIREQAYKFLDVVFRRPSSPL